jgi:hypothetical protein
MSFENVRQCLKIWLALLNFRHFKPISFSVLQNKINFKVFVLFFASMSYR